MEQNRREICRLLWELWCPNWKFTNAEYNETAASFDNPDFVEIVIHSYRHRHGAAPGDPALEAIEHQLVGRPAIEVPAIVLHGEGDGVHPPERSKGQEKLFSKYYERWLVPKPVIYSRAKLQTPSSPQFKNWPVSFSNGSEDPQKIFYRR